jgi:hypothetical protein
LIDLSNTLRSDGISVVARQSNEGKIYGMTFIDHQYRCVFNGSDLGRNYSAQAIQERCTLSPEIIKQEKQMLGQKNNVSINKKLENKRSISSSEKDEFFFDKHQRFDLLEKLMGRGLQQGGGGGDDLADEQRLTRKKKKRLHL